MLSMIQLVMGCFPSHLLAALSAFILVVPTTSQLVKFPIVQPLE